MIKAQLAFGEIFTTRNFSSSPLTISGLLGDTYDYEIIACFTNASGDSIMDVTFNADAGTNYRNFEMKGLSGTPSAAVGNSDTALEFQNLIGTANPNLLKMTIKGLSGNERHIDSLYIGDGAIFKQAGYWKNTANEITSITFTAASSVTCNARIYIYRTPKISNASKWELLPQQLSWSAETATKSFTGLNGDRDKQYKVDYDGTSVEMHLRINSSTATYFHQFLRNSTGSLQSAFTNPTYIHPLTACSDYKFIINAESGAKRLVIVSSDKGGYSQVETACSWNNTADNITSINLNVLNNNLTATAKIYRRINPAVTGDSLPFEIIYNEEISGDFSGGVTLATKGDEVLLYKIEFIGKNASGDIELRVQYNSDTATNYLEQLLKGAATVASAPSTTRAYHVAGKLQNADQAETVMYIYPLSGTNRPVLTECSYDENEIEKIGQHWLNSADEITAIKIFASSTNSVTGNLKVSRILL